MVKLYNNTTKRYVKGYGHVPVVHHGNGLKEILFKSGKQLGSKTAPVAKKVWQSLTPDAQNQLKQRALALGTSSAQKLLQGAEHLGGEAQGQLEQLVNPRMSDKAKKILKKLTKKTKAKIVSKVKSKIKNHPLMKQLSKSQLQTLEKGSMQTLSSLLSGKGLKLMS